MIKIPNNVIKYSKVNHPNQIKVIKQRRNKIEKDLWCTIERTDKYYSSIFNDKHYIYAFFNETSANKCYLFLEHYKKINNKYPDLHGKKYVRDVSDISQIYVCNDSVYLLKRECLLNGIGLIGINNFDYTFIDSFFGQRNVFNLSISAIDLLDNETVNETDQIENLNYLLDF